MITKYLCILFVDSFGGDEYGSNPMSSWMIVLFISIILSLLFIPFVIHKFGNYKEKKKQYYLNNKNSIDRQIKIKKLFK